MATATHAGESRPLALEFAAERERRDRGEAVESRHPRVGSAQSPRPRSRARRSRSDRFSLSTTTVPREPSPASSPRLSCPSTSCRSSSGGRPGARGAAGAHGAGLRSRPGRSRPAPRSGRTWPTVGESCMPARMTAACTLSRRGRERSAGPSGPAERSARGPRSPGGDVYVKADDGFLYRLDAEKGLVRWKAPVEEKPIERIPDQRAAQPLRPLGLEPDPGPGPALHRHPRRQASCSRSRPWQPQVGVRRR